MARTLKMAFVGCGHIAEMHLRGIQAGNGEIEVTAVVDANFERAVDMARRTGAKPFERLEDALIASDFSAVNIMLPHSLHEDATLLSFAAGKHVILEKPISTSVESAERILSAAHRSKITFMVAENSQYWPDVDIVRRQILEGAIGELITGRAFMWRQRSERAEKSLWRNRLAITGGGVCIDGGAHWIRPLRIWFGEILEVISALGRPLTEMEGESLAHCLLRFQSGAVVALGLLADGKASGAVEEFRITGTKGELVIDRSENGMCGRVVKYGNEPGSGVVLMENVQEKRRDAFAHELNDFANAILRGTPLQAGPETAMGELRTAAAIYRSAKSRRWEPV